MRHVNLRIPTRTFILDSVDFTAEKIRSLRWELPAECAGAPLAVYTPEQVALLRYAPSTLEGLNRKHLRNDSPRYRSNGSLIYGSDGPCFHIGEKQCRREWGARVVSELQLDEQLQKEGLGQYIPF